MILLEITSAKNKDLIGVQKIHNNSFTLGNEHCDVYAECHNAYVISIENEKLIFDNANTRYLLNGKLASLKRSLKQNDLIKIENVEFKINSFEPTIVTEQNKLIENKLKSSSRNSTEVINIIKNILDNES